MKFQITMKDPDTLHDACDRAAKDDVAKLGLLRAGGGVMRWALSHKADKRALPLADAHYNRQKPGTLQYAPPGPGCEFLSLDGRAVWVTRHPRYAQQAWLGAWINTLFRNENPENLSSELILEAVAATRAVLGEPPALGMVTFVDASQVRRKRDPGRCYRRAGFVAAEPEFTQGGLHVFQLLPAAMPMPCAPYGYTASLFERGAA